MKHEAPRRGLASVADPSHNSLEVQVACALRDLLRNLTGSAKIIWHGVVSLGGAYAMVH